MRTLNLNDVIIDPQNYFKSPAELLDDGQFTQDQKRQILRCWELDVKLLQTCDEENMSNDQETKMLSRIHQALTKLNS